MVPINRLPTLEWLKGRPLFKPLMNEVFNDFRPCLHLHQYRRDSRGIASIDSDWQFLVLLPNSTAPLQALPMADTNSKYMQQLAL